jgi:hypothetical protein
MVVEFIMEDVTTVPLGPWRDELSHIRLSMRKLMQQVGTASTREIRKKRQIEEAKMRIPFCFSFHLSILFVKTASGTGHDSRLQ